MDQELGFSQHISEEYSVPYLPSSEYEAKDSVKLILMNQLKVKIIKACMEKVVLNYIQLFVKQTESSFVENYI